MRLSLDVLGWCLTIDLAPTPHTSDTLVSTSAQVEVAGGYVPPFGLTATTPPTSHHPPPHLSA